MAAPFEDAVDPSHGPRLEALQGGAPIHLDAFDYQGIHVDLGPLLGIACPTTLFPYVRETISTVTARAGFPPVVLAPMSFDALYQQQVAQQMAAAGAKPN